jgi:hypothetical protein
MINIHPDGIEWFWICATLLSLILTVNFYRETRGDKDFLIRNHLNGMRLIVAKAAIRRYLVKIVMATCLVIPAVLVFFSDQSLRGGLRALFLICLSLLPLLMLLLNIIDRLEKIHLHSYFDSHPAEQEFRDVV